MRIQQNPNTNAVRAQGKASADRLGAEVREGDAIKAKVLFSEGGNVHLKTPDGQLIKGRLEGDAVLAQGQEVTLVVTERTDDVIYLAVAGEEGAAPKPGGAAEVAALASDERLAPLVQALESQGLPVSRQAVEAMARLLEDYPDMPLERAAFLAVNKVSQEQAMLNAAERLLDGEGKAGEMLLQLSAMFSAEKGGRPEVARALAALLGGEAPSAETRQEAAAILGSRLLGDDGATLSQGLETAVNTLPPAEEGEAPLQSPPAQTAVAEKGQEPPQPVSGPPAEAGAAEEKQAVPGQKAPDTEGARPPVLQAAETAVRREAVPVNRDPAAERVNQGAEELPGSGALAETEAAPKGASLPRETDLPKGADLPRGEAGARVADLPREERTAPPVRMAAETPSGNKPEGGLLAELARLPDFSRLGNLRTQEFVGILERAANEITTILASKDPAGGMKRFIDKMFADVDQWEAETPSLLRQARDELYLRLSLVKETLEQTQMLAGKPAMLEQTQKLMDHIRLLGEIEQYVCAQIPIQIGGEQKTCELYVYQNKKGGRRIDPENARILLSLDLTHMGHLQAMVGIAGKEVSIRFEVEKSQWADFIRSQTAALHAMLAGSGYKLTEAKVDLLKQEANAGNALLALREYESGRTAGIDYRI